MYICPSPHGSPSPLTPKGKGPSLPLVDVVVVCLPCQILVAQHVVLHMCCLTNQG